MMGSNHTLTVDQVVKATGARKAAVEELRSEMEKGRTEKKAIEVYKMTSKDMKNKDFAYAYGIHQRLYTNNSHFKIRTSQGSGVPHTLPFHPLIKKECM
jgi:hypothetical protein